MVLWHLQVRVEWVSVFMAWHHSTLLWFTNLHNRLTGRNILTQVVKDHMRRRPWPSESLYNIQTHMEICSLTWHITTQSDIHSSHTHCLDLCFHTLFLLNSIHCSVFWNTFPPCLHLFFPLTLTFSFTLLSYSLSTPSVNSAFFTFCCLCVHPYIHSATLLFPFRHLT